MMFICSVAFTHSKNCPAPLYRSILQNTLHGTEFSANTHCFVFESIVKSSLISSPALLVKAALPSHAQSCHPWKSHVTAGRKAGHCRSSALITDFNLGSAHIN